MQQKITYNNISFKWEDGTWKSVLESVKEESEYMYARGWLLHDTCTTYNKNPINGVEMHEVMATYRRSEEVARAKGFLGRTYK